LARPCRRAARGCGVAAAAIDRGDTDEAAGLLLTAAQSFDDVTAPDAMQIAFHRLNEAMEDKRVYPLPPGAITVEGPDALYFIDPAGGDILRFDGSAPPAVVVDGRPEASPIRNLGILADGAGFILVRKDGTVERVAPGEAPRKVGSLVLEEGEIDPYEEEERIDIHPDGMVFVARYPFEPRLQILDTATGRAYAGGEEVSRPEYVLLPDGRRYLAPASGILEIVDDGSALSLLPVSFSEEDVGLLRIYACFASTGSDFPAEMPEIDIDESFYDHRCRTDGDGVVHTYFSSGSGGIGRYDDFLRAGADPVRLGDTIVDISSYDLRHNFAWSGYDPDLGAFTVLVNRDLLVFDEYQMKLIRKHPVEVGPGRLLGDGRIAIVEPAANRVTVRDISGGELRAALSRANEAVVAKGEQQITPLNTGTCVGYAMGTSGALVRDAVMPDGVAVSIAGSSRTSSDGPPKVVVTSGEDRREIEAGAEEACLQVSRDWKRAIALTFDNKATVLDFERLFAGASLAEATLDVLPGQVHSAFPVGEGGIVTSSYEGAVHLWEKDGAGEWRTRELYRGDYPVFYAEPDEDGDRLLIIESTGGGDARGFLYSVAAGQRWLELGSDYKWFGAAFADDGGIVSGAGGPGRFIDLPPLSALVAETRGRLPSPPSAPDS